MLKVINNVMELNGISRIATAGPVVRNDEAVGSIPTSSTKFSITCRLYADLLCPKLVQNFSRLAVGNCLNKIRSMMHLGKAVNSGIVNAECYF